jgi:hypothetical protein
MDDGASVERPCPTKDALSGGQLKQQVDSIFSERQRRPVYWRAQLRIAICR